MNSTSISSEQYAIAKTIYNEARGEGDEGMAAVASTILNRKKLNRSYWGGSTFLGVVSKKYAYEGYTKADPNPVSDGDKKAW
jgi:spore germination cell wall hydrolase CwlJ-like protein